MWGMEPESQVDRFARKRLMLEEFDRRRTWPGVCWYAEKYGVSRQWVSELFKKERGSRYGRLKHPTMGRRGTSSGKDAANPHAGSEGVGGEQLGAVGGQPPSQPVPASGDGFDLQTPSFPLTPGGEGKGDR